MVLLKGHSLDAGEWFAPESMSLTLEERQGSASMILGPEAPVLAVDDWLQDDTEPGKGIVWRVRTIDENYQTKTRSVTLEHIVATLRDHVIFGSLTPEDMGGTEGLVSARTAAVRVLGHQNDWKLGDFAYESVMQPFEFTGDSVGAALETICSTCEDAEWSYDFGAYPFTLHIRPRSTADIAELREGRNLATARKTVDRSGLYTRIYPIGQNDLRLPEGYLSQNEGQYGTVEKIETDSTMDTEAKLRAWAAARLKRHCVPTVTVNVTGLDLSQGTGESLDAFRIGKHCRIPMPDIGQAIEERIIKLNWRDKIGSPEIVMITLANSVDDVATIMRQEKNRSGGGGGAKRAKKEKEDHAWFVDTEEHVAMVAEAVAGEGAAQDWSRVAQVVVDGEGVHQRVTKAVNDIVTATASIEVLEKSIDLEVKERKTADTEQAASIKVISDQIALKVSKGGVATQLAVECGNVRVTGGNLIVDGIVTADAVQSAIAKITGTVNTAGLLVNGTATFASWARVPVGASMVVNGTLTVPGTFTFKGHETSWKSQHVVTGITYKNSAPAWFVRSSGSDGQSIIGATYGHIIESKSETTIYYIGR